MYLEYWIVDILYLPAYLLHACVQVSISHIYDGSVSASLVVVCHNCITDYILELGYPDL